MPINHFILSVVSEKVSAIMTEEYIASRAKRPQKVAFKKFLDHLARRVLLCGGELAK